VLFLLLCRTGEGSMCPKGTVINNVQYRTLLSSISGDGFKFYIGVLGKVSDRVYYAGLFKESDMIIYNQNPDGSQKWAKVYVGYPLLRDSVVISDNEVYMYSQNTFLTKNQILKINTVDGSVSQGYNR